MANVDKNPKAEEKTTGDDRKSPKANFYSIEMLLKSGDSGVKPEVKPAAKPEVKPEMDEASLTAAAAATLSEWSTLFDRSRFQPRSDRREGAGKSKPNTVDGAYYDTGSYDNPLVMTRNCSPK